MSEQKAMKYQGKICKEYVFVNSRKFEAREGRKIKDWALHIWSLNPGIFVRWGTTTYCVLAAFSTAFNLC